MEILDDSPHKILYFYCKLTELQPGKVYTNREKTGERLKAT